MSFLLPGFEALMFSFSLPCNNIGVVYFAFG